MKAASLNHVYRVVWSHIQNAWTVVSETAKSSGKKSSVINASAISASAKALPLKLTSSTKIKLTLAAALSTLAMSNSAFALPTGAENIYGSFDSVTNGSTMTINQHTGKSIVNWQTFNIASGEAVNLLQPAGGVALYRVVGNNVSEIYGQLTASGQLFLINPNGILFGETAQVSVGSIVASSLDIKNDDFLNGRYHFTAADNAGSVINKGAIKADDEGYIVMLGKTVVNEGTLVANNGSVVLAAAKEAILDFYGNGLVKARLTGEAVDALVKNSGLIQANGGFVQLATSARSAAINVSGIIEANQLVERDGVIRLEGGDNAKVQVSGQLIAKGEGTTGGTIEVTGEQVALMKGALLDASGDTGGGTVLVGGDYQGKNGAVYNARTTYIAEGATIKADALLQGDGGKVIVWADDLTRYYGSISAQGGTNSGNGGFVEVSGKQNLAFIGKVNVGAENGLGGKVLLDPENIVLDSSTQASPTDNANGTPDVAFADNAGFTTTIQVSDVVGFSELFLQANNNIDVNSALHMTNLSGSVRLEAGNDINVNAGITSGYFGTVNLKADADNSGSGNLNIGASIIGYGGINLSAVDIKQTAGALITSGNPIVGHAGNVVINATGNIALGAINANGTTIGVNSGANGGSVQISTSNGSVSLGNISTTGSASGNSAGGGGEGGSISITAKNDVTTGNITTSSGNAGTSSTVSALSGEVDITSTVSNIKTGSISTRGGLNNLGANVTLSAGDKVETGVILTMAGSANVDNDGKSAGAINVSAVNSINVGTINASGANGNGVNKSGGNAGKVDLQSTNGDVVTNAITNIAGVATGSGVNGQVSDVVAQSGNDIVVNGNINAGSVLMSATNDIAVNGNIGTKNSNSITLTADADNSAQGNLNVTGFLRTETGAINLNGVNVIGSNLIKTAGGNVVINATNLVQLVTGIETYKSGLNSTAVNGGDVTIQAGEVTVGNISTFGSSANPDINAGHGGNVSITSSLGNIVTGEILTGGGLASGTGNGGNAGNLDINAKANLDLGLINTSAGTATGTGNQGTGGKVLAQAGADLNLNGNIQTTSQAADAVQLVAGANFKNNVDATITTGAGGQWTIYSSDPTNDVKGANLLASYDYKQYGTTFGGSLLGTGNGFVHQVSPTITAGLSGTATKPFDGNNVVTDTSGLTLALSGLIDGDRIKNSPVVIAGATFDTPAIGAGKPIAATYVVSFETQEGKAIFNPLAGTVDGYTINNTSTATGSITEIPSPRDDAGLGGLIGNNPALNIMSIVSLNPAAGDEEDPDAVACPVNQDSFGSTPILNSGVKLPNGVTSNCI
ncbi:two-partner secretion domain-containing protein [Methylophilus aquaticus]|uniref:Filamentous hemagglutinin N-terminal domain-containing protein n=1 Tax=Methylophilus aquaticus TaxID=1971610 RepID=A0ABT9JTV2_9PROT|nr:filamentous hemagglutinin N-terminal domain-containing protein [Methylophilus aquaticus]MDP8567949.1 filamentous hemagglutinin N-terminal domain-containing protein [Methylophilus aquaticus]